MLNLLCWQHYIEQEIGFVLPDKQLQWLANAIDSTASLYNLSIEQLWILIQTDAVIRQKLVDTVLIPESRFFRHPPSIQFVTELAIDKNIADKDLGTPFRIWSVGCSAGQEVWSLAMSLSAIRLTNYTILGTDVSQTVLSQAREAYYEQHQQYLIPQSCQQFVTSVVIDNNQDNVSRWQVDSGLRQYVKFVWHNIFTDDMPTTNLQQVIICQNVLIYFRQFDQRDILTRLAKQCVIGGYIILAPGEGLGWRPTNMRRISHAQVNAWQKIRA